MTQPTADPTQGMPAAAVYLTEKNETRIKSIDVIRGIALLGILLISIWEFGGFHKNEETRLRLLEKGLNYQSIAAILILVEGKMRALFALVFGASMLSYFQKTAHPGLVNPQELYIRRQLWLIGFGLLNAIVLLFPGDMLFQLGVVGILLFPFFRLSKNSLLVLAIVFTLVYSGKQYWNYADDKTSYAKFKAVTALEEKFKKDSAAAHKKDSLAGKSKVEMAKQDSLRKKRDTLNTIQKNDKSNWEGLVKGLKYDSTKAAEKEENKVMRGSYNKIWNHLLGRSQYKEAPWTYKIGIWDLGSMMLFGMALFGFGFFGKTFSTLKYGLIAVVGISIGLLLAYCRLELNHEKLIDYVKYINNRAVPPNQLFPIERVALALGYASLIMLFIKLTFLRWLWDALAAVGKMAFTNYFLQTIICTIFFYGYGMGYYGRFILAELYFFVAEVWLIQIVFSVFWMRYFEYGPLEWLWRCLVQVKWINIKKATA
jgi:uncharacterized protein